MVKEVVESVVIEGCTVQEFHDAVFAGPEATLQYHIEANKDPKAKVGPWDAAGVRSVAFVVPLQLPAVVRSAIGQDSLPIKETQTLRFEPDGSLVVDSSPLLDVTGGSKFTTAARFVVSRAPSGCRVTATISCTAAGPWGMQGKIESVMTDQARITIGEFLRFCERWCRQHKAVPHPAVPSSQPATTLSSTADAEQFFDAVEDAAAAAAATAAAKEATASEREEEANAEEQSTAAAENNELVVAAELGFERAVLLYMRHLHMHSQQTIRLLETMEARLQGMEANIAAVRGVVAPHRRGSQKASVPYSSSWQAVYSSRYLYWGLGIATAVGTVSAVVAYRRRST